MPIFGAAVVSPGVASYHKSSGGSKVEKYELFGAGEVVSQTERFPSDVASFVPMALVAVAVAHANPTFNAPNNTSISLGNSCAGGATSGSLGGSVTNGGLGITLSGNASLTYNIAPGTCTLLMVWKGTGSGAFNGTTASIGSNFTITPPSNVTIYSYNLAILINGVQERQFTCSVELGQPLNANRRAASKVVFGGNSCSGPISVPTQSFSVPGNLNSYEVDLSVNGAWNDANHTTMTVSVPSSTSIDLLAPGTPTPVAAPALSSSALAATALLLALAAYRMAGWKASGTTPGPRA
jgi:hypothetical protein